MTSHEVKDSNFFKNFRYMVKELDFMGDLRQRKGSRGWKEGESNRERLLTYLSPDCSR